MNEVVALWVFLSREPLLWLTLTLAVYVAADALSAASGRHPLANPVLLSILAIGGVLLAADVRFESYFAGAQFIHFLLGPATIALAVPLMRQRDRILRLLAPIAIALLAGSITAIAGTIGLAALFGLEPGLVLALAPKSATAAIAMGIGERIGAEAALAAVLAILTGILGAVVATPLLALLRIRDRAAGGFAIGLAAHGIGTARAFQIDPLAGAFAGIALGLNGLATSILLPVLLPLLRP